MNPRTHWAPRIGALGVWRTFDQLPATELAGTAGRIEELGYGTVWTPDTTGRDPFALLAHLGTATTDLHLATGIANIFHRHPGPMAQATSTLAELTGGRFLLAVGVSHAAMVEGVRGLDWSRPLSTMRSYLEQMAEAPSTVLPAPRPAPRLIGALGPKMLELSAEIADGAHPYWTTVEHTDSARAIIGPDRLLCVEQKVLLTTDREVVRATAARAIRPYAALPNYRNNWLRLGFTDEEIDGIADRFVDAVIAWGDPDRIRARIAEHHEAGADHVCIQPMTPGHPLRNHDEALEALAPLPSQGGRS